MSKSKKQTQAQTAHTAPAATELMGLVARGDVVSLSDR